MNMAQSAVSLRMSLILLVLWIMAFSLACMLTGLSTGGRQDSILVKLMGSSRAVFSGQFFLEADRCFHKGIGYYRKKAFIDWFVKLNNDIKPSGHVHLHDKGVEEIMPWLYFSTRADPQNVVAYKVAAFWLAREARRPDLAEQVLQEAQRHNPRDFRVYLEKGRLALKQGKQVSAANAFDAAIRLWPSGQDPDDIETRMDKAEVLVFRGLLYEIDGNIDQALSMYKEILNIFPGREGLRKRVEELETRGQASVSPFDLWKVILFHHRHVSDKENSEPAELTDYKN